MFRINSVGLGEMLKHGVVHGDIVPDSWQPGGDFLPRDYAMAEINHRNIWKMKGSDAGFDMVLAVDDVGWGVERSGSSITVMLSGTEFRGDLPMHQRECHRVRALFF